MSLSVRSISSLEMCRLGASVTTFFVAAVGIKEDAVPPASDIDVALKLGMDHLVNDCLDELYVFAMGILARHLAPIELPLSGIVQALIAIPEVDRRVPHVQAQKFGPLSVVEHQAIGTVKDFARVRVVNRVTMRAKTGLERDQILIAGVFDVTRAQVRCHRQTQWFVPDYFSAG
jgi:hypothetical protein